MTPSEALLYLKTMAATNCACVAQHKVVLAVLDDLKFVEWPASQRQHHAYSGGLVVHTAEVLRGSLALASAYPTASAAVLTCAAIFHDCEKVRDYEPNWVMDNVSGILVQTCDDEHPGGWRYTDYTWKIRHVAGSYAKWTQLAARFGLDQDFTDEVGHCILAHHGLKEWGSPVEPQTVEAKILHSADVLSASYGPGREITR